MMKLLNNSLKSLAVMLLVIGLAACADTDGPPEDLIGTAATGYATQGNVFIVGAHGAVKTEQISSNGVFKVDVRTMTAPFMLKTVADNGLDPDLYSYAAEANIEVNVTPLTNVAMFVANGNADPADLYDNWSSTFVSITPEIVTNAQATVNANLLTQYTAFSLDPFTYNFSGTRFVTNGASIDGLLEAMTVAISGGFVDIFVTEVGTIAFDTAVDVSEYDIGGTAVATTGAYTVTIDITVAGSTSTAVTLSINLPASYLPTAGNTVMVEDIFKSFYGTLGAITINSATVTGDAAETVVELDATIATTKGDVNYLATYTYTQNI